MNKKAILIVDDEAIILFSLKQEISDYFENRFHYETALNAIEAFKIIEELAKKNIELILIISDYLMPGMKGDEFLLKVYEKYKGIKTILITGQADPDSINHLKVEINLGAVVNKPWEKDELIQEIEKQINNYEK